MVQTDHELKLPRLPVSEHVELILTPPRGVSAARNLGLDRVRSCARQVMFADSATIPSTAFIRAAQAMDSDPAPVWLANVDWNLIAGAEHLAGSPHRANADPVVVAYQGFLWRCVFKVKALSECRFLEEIGPGASGRIQSGEDCIFLADVIERHQVRSIPFLSDASLERLPRENITRKKEIYAYGSGYRAANLLLRDFSVRQKMRLILRISFFLLQSLKNIASSESQIGKDRILGFCAGIKDGPKGR